MTPCYCAECKRQLTVASISGDNTAWCAHCRNYVVISCFEVPSWIMGVLLLLTTTICV